MKILGFLLISAALLSLTACQSAIDGGYQATFDGHYVEHVMRSK